MSNDEDSVVVVDKMSSNPDEDEIMKESEEDGSDNNLDNRLNTQFDFDLGGTGSDFSPRKTGGSLVDQYANEGEGEIDQQFNNIDNYEKDFNDQLAKIETKYKQIGLEEKK